MTGKRFVEDDAELEDKTINDEGEEESSSDPQVVHAYGRDKIRLPIHIGRKIDSYPSQGYTRTI